MTHSTDAVSDISSAPSVVFRGGTVLTMDGSQTVLENADVLVVGEKIEAVGPALEVPEGTAEIDATGGIVMPGMVDTTGTCGRRRCAATAPTGR